MLPEFHSFLGLRSVDFGYAISPSGLRDFPAARLLLRSDSRLEIFQQREKRRREAGISKVMDLGEGGLGFVE